MSQWRANSKLTCVRKIRIPLVEEKFVISYLVLYSRENFLRDSDEIIVQKRVIIVELAERSPIIIQSNSNPSSRKKLDVRPFDCTRCYF